MAAGLILLALVFLLALGLRWALYGGRELWLTRGLPLTGRPAIDAPFLMGEFVDAVAEPGLAGGQIVRQALTEKLLAWNQLVEVRITPVEPALPPHLDSAAWLRAFWQWVAPPSRGYEVRGSLYRNGQTYGLAVQRISLRRRRVDCGQTFESTDAPAADAFRAMAGEAAKWLLQPDDMEAAAAPQGSRAVSPDGPLPDQLPPTASEAFDRALTLLLPVRHMLQQGALNEADALCRLEEAREMAEQLPAQSGLRREIEEVVGEIGKQVR